MLRLAETERLDKQAMVCAAAGALVAALGSVVTSGAQPWFGLLGPAVMLAASSGGGARERIRGLLLGGVATAAGLAWLPWRLFGEATTGALLAWALLWQATKVNPSMEKPSRWARWGTVLLGAMAWPVVLAALNAVQGSTIVTGEIPPAVVFAAAGGLSGLLVGLLTVPAHLEPAADPVASALSKSRPMLDGELRDLVLRIVEARSRALKLLEQSRADVRARTETKRGLDGLALTAIELTDRFGAVERVLGRTPGDAVGERTGHLRAQLEESTDPGVRRDLERAITALEEQKAQLDRLRQGRARLLARLESELASLERTETSLALLASGDAALSGVRLESIGSALARQAQELDAEGSALQEALVAVPAVASARVRAG